MPNEDKAHSLSLPGEEWRVVWAEKGKETEKKKTERTESEYKGGKKNIEKKSVALINKLADASKEKKDGGEAGERVKGGERGLVERIG